jgi:hypothetical protein
MVRIDTRGFDELERKAKEAERRSAAGIQLKELFPSNFMTKYSDFRSIDEMVQASGVTFKSIEDFNEISEQFISSHTRFSNWKEMLNTASAQWFAHSLGID